MSFRWIIASFLLIAGAVVMATVLNQFVGPHLPESALAYASYILFGLWGAGALAGGYVTGKASPGTTVIEPAIGGGLFIAALISVVWFTPLGEMITRLSPALADESHIFAAKLGGTVFGGALLGGILGERSQSRSGEGGFAHGTILAWMMINGALFLGVIGGVLLSGLGGETAEFVGRFSQYLVGVVAAFGGLVAGLSGARLSAGVVASLLVIAFPMLVLFSQGGVDALDPYAMSAGLTTLGGILGVGIGSSRYEM